MDPLILILIFAGVALPIVNGKTILQLLLGLLIPQPEPASTQAWHYWTAKAEEALAAGDTAKAEELAGRAAREAAEWRAKESEFDPAGIWQMLLRMLTGGGSGQLLPLVILAVVGGMLMNGCDLELPREADAAEVLEMPTSELSQSPVATDDVVWRTAAYRPRLPAPVELDPWEPPQLDLPELPAPAPETPPEPQAASEPVRQQVIVVRRGLFGRLRR